MKCVNCGAIIQDGSIYCPVCGKEAQVVNGYTSLEDDLLHSLIRESAEDTGSNGQEEKEPFTQEEKSQEPEKKKPLPMLAIVFSIAAFLIFSMGLKVYVDYKNDNSYEYQVKMAQKEASMQNYELAMQHYARALAIHPTEIDCRMEMAAITMRQENYNAATVLLQEVIQLDNSRMDAYEALITIYEKQGQYEQIRNLAKYSNDPKILQLFSDYLVEKPVLYPEGGNHDTAITITMVSMNDEPIYYTTDGSDPTINGMLYEKGIAITRSTIFTIRAVCKNPKNGIYSEEVKKEYEIVIVPPAAPRAFPAGGSVFSEQAYITLKAGEECSIYYTWDGTVPTADSEKYTAPIAVPEGEYILFAIAVNEHTGLISEVMQESYTYIAETEEGIEDNPEEESTIWEKGPK